LQDKTRNSLFDNAVSFVLRESFHLQRILRQEGYAEVEEVAPKLKSIISWQQVEFKNIKTNAFIAQLEVSMRLSLGDRKPKNNKIKYARDGKTRAMNHAVKLRTAKKKSF